MALADKPLNILHLLPSAIKGGSELCALETIKALSVHNNYVIVPSNGNFLDELKANTKKLDIIPNNWWLSNPKWSFLLRLKMIWGFYKTGQSIASYIEQNKVDIIITHSIVIPSGAMGAWFNKKPHIWYIHEYGDIDHGFKFNYSKRLSLYLINKLSAQIVINSKALHKHFSSYLPLKKLNTINYVVDYPLNQPNNCGNLMEICMVGRIAAGKNQIIALQAINQLKQEGLTLNIKFLGGRDNAYYSELMAYINKHMLVNQVNFVGFSEKPYLEVLKSEIVLVCSKNEAFGRVTIEGMKSGKIVVASNTGAGKELIEDGINGYLFSPDDHLQLASILKRIITNPPNQVMKQNAFTFASKNFTFTKHQEAIEQVINKSI